MRWFVLIGLMVMAVVPAVAAADPVRLPTPVVDDSVDALAFAGDTLYLGGNFETIGARTGPGVGIDAGTGLDLGLPAVSGGSRFSTVFDAIPDGAGGWYIAGDFAQVGGVVRHNVAQILADGTVGAFDPDVDGVVGVLARSGSTVYLGGEFTAVGGSPRRNLAEVDSATGVASAWNPDLDAPPYAIAVAGPTVYVGGGFKTVNGNVTRTYAAAFDAGTGTATNWNPNLKDRVLALAISGSTVYLGGYFRGARTSTGNVTRNYAAAVDAQTGFATAWNPNLNYEVYDLQVSGSTVYINGAFYGNSAINGNVKRNHVAAVDATTGVATAWNPNPDGWVEGLEVSGSTVYLAGEFESVGGQDRRNLAAVDATTGAATAWSPNSNGTAYTVAVADGTVYAGGLFSSVNVLERHHAAAIDLDTGRPTAWNPDVNGGVQRIAVAGSTVYFGGTFTAVNGDKVRDRLAAVDATTGAATAWAPTTTGWVSQLKVAVPTVYLGGKFSAVDGTPRNHLAAVTADTGAVTPWDPDVEPSTLTGSSVIDAMEVLGSRIYVAGYIAKLGGVTRATVGAVDATTGAVEPWAPAVDQWGVHSLAVSGANVYLGGQFTTVSGVARSNLASVDATTGAVTGWDPKLSTPPYELAADASNVHVFGNFDPPLTVGGNISRNFLLRLDPLTAAVSDWEPSARRQIGAIATTDSGAFAAGGQLYTFGDDSLAVFGSAPRFTAQPAGRTVTTGADATFIAAVSGFPTPTLQWQKFHDDAGFTDLAGQTGATLTIPAATMALHASTYRLRATSPAGTTFSDSATLLVRPEEEPADQAPAKEPPAQGQPAPEQPPSTLTPPATKPTPGRVRLSSSTATVRDGIARVTLTCTGGTTCAGTLTLTIPGRRAGLVSARYTVGAGTRMSLKLRVSHRVHQLLFAFHTRRQTTVTFTATSGLSRKATLTLHAYTRSRRSSMP
jgi:hypothetical protein